MPFQIVDTDGWVYPDSFPTRIQAQRSIDKWVIGGFPGDLFTRQAVSETDRLASNEKLLAAASERGVSQ